MLKKLALDMQVEKAVNARSISNPSKWYNIGFSLLTSLIVIVYIYYAQGLGATLFTALLLVVYHHFTFALNRLRFEIACIAATHEVERDPAWCRSCGTDLPRGGYNYRKDADGDTVCRACSVRATK